MSSIVYFTGVCALGFSCLVVFFCRQYIKYFPRPLVWLLCVEASVLVFDLLMHSPLAPAKNLWFMLVMSTHALVPVMTVIASNALKSSSSEETQSIGFKVLLGLTVFCVLLGFYRIPLIEFHSEWALSRAVPSFFAEHYYRVLTLNTVAYLIVATISLKKLWVAISEVRDESGRRYLVQLLFWSLALGLIINVGRIFHCNTVGAAGFTSLVLSVLDVLLSCTFLLAILVVILRMTLQDIPVNDQGTALSQSVSKYGKHRVSLADSERIQNKLNQALANKHLVTDSSLTLTKLSAHIGEKHHAVSQVINRDLLTSFFDLIYGQRVDLACSLIRDNPEMPVVEIYTEVGFNSKTTFYKAFKKRKDQTLAEFRRQASPQ